MNKKEILLIAGSKGTGKDYLCSLIIEELKKHNIVAQRYAFADKPKEMLCQMFGISLDDFNKYKNKKSKIYVKDKDQYVELTDFRSLIQTFGTEVMQGTFGKNVWVDFLIDNINSDKDIDISVISDFRFKHEDISNKKILIINKDIKENDQHISENDLKDTHFPIIVDNTSQPDLSKQIDKIMTYLFE